ncbi:hypothetical protein [Halobacterium hubeiense]|uniref:hypothetical protein n=1 Tax=Halobacterium hubeiense TaxID=1407499 RepID=UPI0012FA7CF3|nr:hypothetical protein [Halobacterium hubeiense]
MGSKARVPSSGPSDDDDTEKDAKLGDLLSGRLSEVDVDSVTTVHERPARD